MSFFGGRVNNIYSMDSSLDSTLSFPAFPARLVGDTQLSKAAGL